MEGVKPIPCDLARIKLTAKMVRINCRPLQQGVDHLAAHFFTMPPEPVLPAATGYYLAGKSDTTDIMRATSEMEHPMRK